MVMIVLALAGSVLVGNDFRYGSLPFYLSKPLSPLALPARQGPGRRRLRQPDDDAAGPGAVRRSTACSTRWDYFVEQRLDLLLGILGYGLVLTVLPEPAAAGDGGAGCGGRCRSSWRGRRCSSSAGCWPAPWWTACTTTPRWRLIDLWNDMYLVGSACLRMDPDASAAHAAGVARGGPGPGRSVPGMPELLDPADPGGGDRALTAGDRRRRRARADAGVSRQIASLALRPDSARLPRRCCSVDHVSQVVRPGHRRQPGDAGAAAGHHRTGRVQRRRQEHAHAPGHRPPAARPRPRARCCGHDAWSGGGQAARRLLPRRGRLLRGNVGPAVRRDDGPAVRLSPPARPGGGPSEALELVGMAGRAERRLRGYSKGMRQRIKLAQALLHDPELLVLDEPLSGIDPDRPAGVHRPVPRAGRARQVPARLQPRAGRAGKADRSRRHHGPRPHRRRRHRGPDPRPARRSSAAVRVDVARGSEEGGRDRRRELAGALLRLPDVVGVELLDDAAGEEGVGRLLVPARNPRALLPAT